jgi:hypothetical protein
MKTINEVLDWYSDRSLLVKIIVFLPVVLVLFMVCLYAAGYSADIVDIYNEHLDKQDKVTKYKIEASEKKINNIEEKIETEKETAREKINNVDTFDSFDDVYNSVVCDRK